MDSTPATMDFVLSIDAMSGGLLIRHLLAPRDRAALACCSPELAQLWTRGDEAQLRDHLLEAARYFHAGRARPAGPLFNPRDIWFERCRMQHQRRLRLDGDGGYGELYANMEVHVDPTPPEFDYAPSCMCRSEDYGDMVAGGDYDYDDGRRCVTCMPNTVLETAYAYTMYARVAEYFAAPQPA